MSPAQDHKTIFLAALDLPAGQRFAWIDDACRGDRGLRERVLALLAASEAAGTFLAEPGPASAADEGRGSTIGRFLLVERIGEGGFGEVWLATQQQPIRRDVAVKIVKRGMDSRQVLARFEQERQALAMMEHPNIARVIDGGETPSGRPFFAMDLVRGVPITTWCDEHRIDAPGRLRLFTQVCDAVQHAHHKGVIHRDLKPTNVLVEEVDGRAVPKVIDFGVAKAIHGRLTDATLVTGFRQIVGTPEYMAPEQAEFARADVDTRADVYSLGVLLYELLTGALPFTTAELLRQGLLELLRVIREVEPPRPSTRITTQGAASESLAARRATDATQLARLLRGDLDWIVMKAIEKDRTRRYATPAELAADVGRHLAHEPVVARPTTATYRLRKLLRRRRGTVIAVAALAIVLLAGGVTSTWFAIEAGRQEAIASARLAEYEQMLTLPMYDQVLADAEGLASEEPEQIPALQAWLANCEQLLARRAGIVATVRAIEARALPATAAELEHDRSSHPKRDLLAAMTLDVAGEQRAQRVREGEPFVEREPTAAERALPPMTSGDMAWGRVAPGAARKVHGEEVRGLALVRAALAAPPSPTAPRHSLLDTLAWALLAVGRDDEAVAALQEALAQAQPPRRAEVEGLLHNLQQSVAAVAGPGGREVLRRREHELATLAAEVGARRTFAFENSRDGFLHGRLRTLVAGIDRLETTTRVVMQRRLRWAQQVDGLTAAHPHAGATWAAAAAAIAAADGEQASTRYRGRGIVLVPQRGLVPIGKNPRTGLWEFYDLRSAWDGTADPAALPIPRHAEDGTIAVTPETGIVLVLLPGGEVAIGAQSTDPQAANHDARAVPAMGPVVVHSLAPFFLARHELTQAQWARLWTGDEALRVPSYFPIGSNLTAAVELTTGFITGANPVESVDWPSCARLLREHGLVFPSEAQWEYACRAETKTPWSCAKEDLWRHANLADATAKACGVEWREFEAWSDGGVAHVGVGRLAPNAFGLHDMHGNVYEWCADGRSGFHGAHFERMSGDTCRGTCGGGFASTADEARCAFRRQPQVGLRSPDLGLRAARELRP